MDQFAAVVEGVTLGVSGIAILALVVDEVAQFLPYRSRSAAAAAVAPKHSVRREHRRAWPQTEAAEVPAV